MKKLLSVMAMAIVVSACAKSHNDSDQSSNSGGGGNGGQGAAGPSGYHTVYANIQDTIVTLKNFRIRTTDGNVVTVTTAPFDVDLQDLQGIGKGLPLNLTGVTFPGGAATLDVAEIESDVVGNDAHTVSSDNSSCDLATPKKMNFYTAAPITVIAGEQYLVKVQFSPLASIQIDLVKKKDCGCKNPHHNHKVLSTAKNYGHNDDRDCDEVTVQRCELVNRRQLTNDIIRPIDEF